MCIYYMYVIFKYIFQVKEMKRSRNLLRFPVWLVEVNTTTNERRKKKKSQSGDDTAF